MKHIASILFYCFLFSFPVFAQGDSPQDIDSLISQLPKMADDTNKVKALYEITKAYIQTDPLKSKPYCEDGLRLAQKLKYQKYIAMQEHFLAWQYANEGNLDESLRLLNSAAVIYKKENLQELYNNAIADEAAVNTQIGNFSKALDANFETLRFYEDHKQYRDMVINFNNIGSLFYDLHDYRKAIQYYRQGISAAKMGNEKIVLPKIYNGLARVYLELKHYDSAYEQLKLGKAYFLSNNDSSGIALVYSTEGDLLAAQKQYSQAVDSYSEALRIYNHLNEKAAIAYCKAEIGNNYLSLYKASINTSNNQQPHFLEDNNLKKSYTYLIDALKLNKDLGIFLALQANYNYLSTYYKLTGDYQNALVNLEEADKYKDSVYSSDNKQTIKNLEDKREIDLRDNQLKISALQLSNQKRQRWIYIGIISTILVIGSMLMYQNRQRKKINVKLTQINTELDEANKVKARFMGILSHDLRAPVANLANYLHLQKEDPELLDETNKKLHQEKIENATHNLLTLMEDMLLWSKGQMTNFQPQIKSIQVLHLFDDVKRLIPEDAGAEVIFNDPGLLQVESDENFLKTIMRNLTANAIKALDNKSDGKIEWKAWEENAKKFISITDNGPGLTEIQVKNLFSENAVTSSKSGLGLHLIRDLAARLNQKIDVISNPGKGTQIILSTVL